MWDEFCYNLNFKNCSLLTLRQNVPKMLFSATSGPPGRLMSLELSWCRTFEEVQQSCCLSKSCCHRYPHTAWFGRMELQVIVAAAVWSWRFVFQSGCVIVSDILSTGIQQVKDIDLDAPRRIESTQRLRKGARLPGTSRCCLALTHEDRSSEISNLHRIHKDRGHLFQH